VIVSRWDSATFETSAANQDPGGDTHGFAYGLRFPDSTRTTRLGSTTTTQEITTRGVVDTSSRTRIVILFLIYKFVL
jgi:hypothetical protein